MLCKILDNGSQYKKLFVFFNGFGSDYKFWDQLTPYFSRYNCVLLSENYFNYPEDYEFQDLKSIFQDKEIIGVGHSLGYHKLCALNLEYDFFNLSKIVSLEGFSRYLGSFEPVKSVRKFYLDQMVNCYSFAPRKTLSNFMAMCGAPIATLPATIKQELLMSDLQLLYFGIASPDIPHLVLSSLDDWVIPSNIVEDNFRKLSDVNIVYTIGAGHLLGMKFPQQIRNRIVNFSC